MIYVARIGENHIKCLISKEAPEDHFGASPATTPIIAFNMNRPAIEKITEKLILANRFELDGEILIKTEDL